VRDVSEPQELRQTIQLIRQHVCEHFYLAEMRDPDLTRRSKRRIFVLPHQVAMYLVRQLTGASLQDIGRQFGGKHHATVLHSINKIEAMRHSDKALNSTIMRLIDQLLR
jgi:chromosomal replication initiator protein